MKGSFRDIGRVANAQEARSSVLVKDSNGNYYFVICSYGFIVSVNLNKKTSSFHHFPNGEKEYPYGSCGSKSGKIYFGAGKMFYEFDPAINEFTFAADVRPKNLSWSAEGWAPTEAYDGKIYFGAHPSTHLMSFDPKTKELTEYGIITEDEEYLASQVVDSNGWIYCAVGTRKPSIIALNLKTGKKKVLASRSEPGNTAEVRLATNGNIYGTLDGTHHGCEYRSNKEWHLLFNGELCECTAEPFKTYYTGEGFDAYHCPLEVHPEIVDQNLIEHEFKYIHPSTGELVELSLDYESEGATLSPMTSTPAGTIYGTTNHPIQLFTYDTKKDLLINHGGKPFAKHIFGWGNICTYARQGNILAGAAYCGGFITRIDLTQPICRAPDNINPVCEGAFPEIFRPRSSASLPDGKTIVFGGFGVNGKAGGGLVIYDCLNRSCKEIPNERLIVGHSVMAIIALNSSRILCATTINAPCGGTPVAKQAVIFEYDLYSEDIIYSISPVTNASSIEHLKIDPLGILHGITGNGVYFACDWKTHCVLATHDLSEHGTPVRDGMAFSSDGAIYGLLTNGIYRINTYSTNAEIIDTPPCPIESGIALVNNKIYFGSPSHLWEYTI